MTSKLVSSLSQPSTKSELNLFSIPGTQVAIEKTVWKEVHLSNPCNSEGPWEFALDSGPEYLQLNKNYLLLELRITKANGGRLTDPVAAVAADAVVAAVVAVPGTAPVAPINMIGATFFRQVKLSLNTTQVYDSSDKYHYRSYLQAELNNNKDTKRTQLGFTGYAREQPADNGDIEVVDNPGFVIRRNNFNYSRKVQLYTPLTMDLMCQDRLLINNIRLRLTLTRNSDKFALLCFEGNEQFKIVVEKMVWYVRAHTLLPSICLDIERTLLTHTCKYPIRRTEVRILHINQSRHTAPENSIFTGTLPRRIIIGLVNSDAVNGVSYRLNPFNFQNFGINEFYVNAGGVVYPTQPLTPDFGRNDYARAYTEFYEGLCLAGDDATNSITPYMYRFGWCLFVVNLSGDGDDGSYFNLLREGSTTVCIKFDDAVAAPGIDIVCMGEFDSMLEIDRFRNVIMDYKA